MEEKSFLEDKLADPQGLVVDELQKWVLDRNPVGYAVMGWPREMFIVLDYTALRGSASNVFWTFTHRVGKMRYTIRKVDEWMEINPNYTELYNQMIGQKQRIEGAIKSSLASVAQAVADYELLKHDSRRYKEILDYFVKGKKDQHVMRSLFVDRVDAFTGEGYSLVTMEKRWPTIITDFIRMKDEWEDVSEIRKDLDVSQAEATVLKTKNELYKEWKTLFLPTVKERYARIQTLVKARNRSIDEYKNWLKPYLAKYKAMKEGTEHKDWSYVNNAFSTPGFGTMDAWTYVRVWTWRPFQPVEAGKPEAMLEKKGKGFIVDPYDDFVRHWKKKIEKHYGVTISDKDVRDILADAINPREHEMAHYPPMEANALYYLLFDMKIILSTMKSPPPEGAEMDNLMFYPIKIWLMSQNSLLIHLLELHARQKWMDRYMDEIIGARSVEEDIYKKVEEEFEEFGGKSAKRKKNEKESSSFWGSLKPRYISKDGDFRPNLAMRFVRFFVKPGPYEPVFFERLSKMYFRASGFYYKQMVDVVKNAMGIE
ncbi:MAG: hypothetical protein NTY20_04165 [Candidatus Aenigmarchaeota archaeon]|nr:hypothetical protein [Candidatus Aenigmarchaeota archaeon]